MPATARSSTDFSFSRVDWKVCEEAFSWLARLRREVVRVSCSRREVVRASSFVEGVVFVLRLVDFASGEGVGMGLVEGVLRLRRVDVGMVAAVLVGVVVDVVEGNGVVVGFIAVGFDSSLIGVSIVFSAMGVANNSFHSSSTSPSSTSSSSSARDSSSSRTLCIRLSSCLSRAISACASCRRSSGFICGRERSSWERRVRA